MDIIQQTISTTVSEVMSIFWIIFCRGRPLRQIKSTFVSISESVFESSSVSVSCNCRATMDIDHLLNKAVLLLDLQETSLEEIFAK